MFMSAEQIKYVLNLFTYNGKILYTFILVYVCTTTIYKKNMTKDIKNIYIKAKIRIDTKITQLCYYFFFLMEQL